MATISSLGIGSGLNLSGLLSQLQTAEQAKLEPITTQKTELQSKLSAYGRLQSALTSLQTAVSKLNYAKTFQAVTTSVSGSSLNAAVSGSAVAGNYAVNVTQLAQAQSLATSGVADQTADLGTGTLSISFPNSTKTALSIDLTTGAHSLQAVRDAINAQGAGVTASIVNDGSSTPYRLVLTSSSGTQSAMSVSVSGGSGQLASMFSYDSVSKTGSMAETVAAKDAALSVNGIGITSQSNVVSGAVQGVTLSLTATGASQVTVATDSTSIKSAVTGFVDAYNSLQTTVSSLSSYDSTTKKAGDLLGDSTLRSIQSRLRSVMGNALSSGSLTRLSDLGITQQLGGQLKVDSTKLDGLVGSNLSALSDFFTGGASGDGFASRMGGVLGGVLNTDGTLDSVTKGVNGQIKSLDDSYAKMSDRITATVEHYRTQFSQLDSLISQMNSTSTYLTQQFNALAAQTKN